MLLEKVDHGCLILWIQYDEAPFHGIDDRNMDERVASGNKSLDFSFRTRPSLGVPENLAVSFTMDMVSIRQELVRLVNCIRLEWLAGRLIGKASHNAAHHACH